jgi:hypothetical protein
MFCVWIFFLMANIIYINIRKEESIREYVQKNKEIQEVHSTRIQYSLR